MEDRQKLWEEYEGEKPLYMARPWLDYNRYRYSNKIVKTLKERKEDFSKLFVLDYGCGVGDYGFDFGRNGATVYFYDNEIYINFVLFRLLNEQKTFNNKTILIPYLWSLEDKIDLVIFGEVLEHLENPLNVITNFVSQKTKYIFTSSYPFRSDDIKDDYWNKSGHNHGLARAQQSEIRKLLFKHYERVQYNGNASLWVRK